MGDENVRPSQAEKTTNESIFVPLPDEEPLAEDDEVVTMVDVLEEEKKLEENAFAVLSGSDEKNCTYLRGYVARQALYSCLTCRISEEKPNGICLACSYACHEGHELVELYTKRNFRCDCGNKLFDEKQCTLCPNKTDFNDKNQYNHNFKGLYCTCDKPYPDSSNKKPMYQCTVCEDWFHSDHLEEATPDENDFDELICATCMVNLPFIWYYCEQVQATKNAPVDVENAQPKVEDAGSFDSGVESSCDSLAGNQPCKLAPLMKKFNVEGKKGSTFWSNGWRVALCKCDSCFDLYAKKGCTFISDQEDTVKAYEDRGRAANIQMSQYERGLKEINKMDRFKSIEAIHECEFMTSALKDYLKKFAENKKVVRAEDIQEFFEGLSARKRARNDESVFL